MLVGTLIVMQRHVVVAPRMLMNLRVITRRNQPGPGHTNTPFPTNDLSIERMHRIYFSRRGTTNYKRLLSAVSLYVRVSYFPVC